MWAHYLHITDTLQTAVQHGLFPDPRGDGFHGAPHLDFDVDDLDQLVAVWAEFAGAFNELNRSMGKADAYPFTLAPPVVAKLVFVHRLIQAARGGVEPFDLAAHR